MSEQGFFDRFPGFLESSHTSPQRDRLNLRHQAIFGSRPELFAGRRVLDLACHDGRWTLAALDAGAALVTGVEAKEDLAVSARHHLADAGYGLDVASIHHGDVFGYLSAATEQYDVVLCLGFLYHTLRYNELFAGIRRTGAPWLVIDTLVRGEAGQPTIRVAPEPVERQGNAVADDFSVADQVLVGRPSVRAVEVMAQAYGYGLEHYADWTALLERHPEATGIGAYRDGKRVTGFFARADH